MTYCIIYRSCIVKLKKNLFHTCGIKCDMVIDYLTAPRQSIDLFPDGAWVEYTDRLFMSLLPEQTQQT